VRLGTAAERHIDLQLTDWHNYNDHLVVDHDDRAWRFNGP
jgi:hypothetical protein